MGIISNKREIYSEFTEYFDPSFYMFSNGNLVLDDGESLSVLEGTAPSNFRYTTYSYQKDYFAIHNNIYVVARIYDNVHYEGQISTDYSEINWVTRTNPIGDYSGSSSSYEVDKAFYLKGADKFIVAAEYNSAGQYLRVAKPSWPLSWSAYTLPNFSTIATFYMANDVFVHMKGTGNNILEFTTDLITWTTSTSPAINSGSYSSGYQPRLVYSGSLYALQGMSSILADETPWTSTDLITWTQGALADPTYNFRGLAGGNGIFIKSKHANYGSGGDHPYRSTDCITWTRATTPITYTGPNWREAFFNEAEQRFEIHNNDPDAAGYALTFYSTTDGVSWTIHSKPLPSDYAASLGASSPAHITQLNNQTRTSQQNLADVIQRQGSDISENYDSIVENKKEVDDKFAEKASLSGASFTGEVDVVSGTSIASASTRQITYSGHDPINGIGNSGDLWLKIVPNSLLVATSRNGVGSIASTDGTTWTQGTLPKSMYWYGTVYAQDKIFAFRDNSDDYASTIDGISWTAGKLPSSRQWKDGATDGNGTIAVIARASTTAAYSTDSGSTWNTSLMPSSSNWSKVAYGNNIWITVSEQFSSATSTDGITWTAASTPLYGTDNIVYGNGLFVGVGIGGVAAATTDGITWSLSTLAYNSNRYYGLAYGDGKFVAAPFGSSNIGSLSTDAVTWTASTLPYSTSWYGVAYSGGKFVAISYQSGYNAISTDGITWTANTPVIGYEWISIVSNGF
jgi:hypothetical protein